MNISISNYWKLPNDSSAFMSRAWFFLEEKYCLANTIVWFFSAEEFKHVTPTPNSWRKNRYVYLPNSDGRVKSSVMLHITRGCCVWCARQVTFDITQPGPGGCQAPIREFRNMCYISGKWVFSRWSKYASFLLYTETQLTHKKMLSLLWGNLQLLVTLSGETTR